MEAIAQVSGGSAVGIRSSSLRRRVLRGPLSESCVCPRARNFPCSGVSLRTVRSPSFFEDQSHVEFYLSAKRETRERGTRLLVKASSDLREVYDGARNLGEQTRCGLKPKKMQKKIKVKSPKSSSSSSSSSESEKSDAKQKCRKKVDIDQLKKEWEKISTSPLMNSIPTFSADFSIIPPVQGQAQGNDIFSSSSLSDLLNNMAPARVSDFAGVSTSGNSLSFAGLTVPCDTSVASAFPAGPVAPGRVEVCMGGKCKKAGAQEILSAFQANGVSASACNKCMKNCRSAINVRIEQEDNDTQMYSAVDLGEVNVLSQRHFGIGFPPAGSSALASA